MSDTDTYDPSSLIGPTPPKKLKSKDDSESANERQPSDSEQPPTIGPLPGAFMSHLTDLTEEEKLKNVRQKFIERENAVSGPSSRPTEREEWMLKPGAQKISAVNALKNRGFNCTASAGDNPAATIDLTSNQTPEELEALKLEQERLQAEIDLYNKKHNRTESLLEKHRKKIRRNSGKSSKKDKKKKDKKEKKEKKSKSKKEKKDKKKKRKSSKRDSSDSDSDSSGFGGF